MSAADDLRKLADDPEACISGTPMVPIQQSTLRALLDERDLMQRAPELARLGALSPISARQAFDDGYAAGTAECAAFKADAEKALDLLATMVDLYEDGASVYEDPDDCAGYLGHAIKLDDDTFQSAVDLLNRLRPRAATLVAARAALKASAA